MNTPPDNHDASLRYAEYVLGVLDAEARAVVEQEIHSSSDVAKLVAMWTERLAPLSEEMQVDKPGDYVWERIRDTLNLAQHAPHGPLPARPRFGQNVRFWQWLGLGTSVLAAACLVLLLMPARHLARRLPVPVTYMVSTIRQTDGHTGWTATMDLQQARIVVVPVSPQAMAPGHAPELWLIPAGQKPVAVGMIDSKASTTLALNDTLIARLRPAAALAVSVEPPGGSPTGQPTGPVIAKGSIGAAPVSGEGSKSASLQYTTAAVRTDV